MRKLYNILGFTFLFLIAGQNSFAQDYNYGDIWDLGELETVHISAPNHAPSGDNPIVHVGIPPADIPPEMLSAIADLLNQQPVVDYPTPGITPITITIYVPATPNNTQNSSPTGEQTVTVSDPTSELYWYLYYSLQGSDGGSDSGGGDNGGGGTPINMDDAPDWYRDLDNDGFHSMTMKSYTYPGIGWREGVSNGLDCDYDTNQDYDNVCEGLLELEVTDVKNRKAITGETLYLLDTSNNGLNLKATANNASEIDWTNGLMWGSWEGYQSYYSNTKISAKAKLDQGYDTKFVNVEIIPYRDVTSTFTPYSLGLLEDRLKNFNPLGIEFSISTDISFSSNEKNELAEDRFINDIKEKTISFSANGGAEVLIPGYSFDWKILKAGIYAGLKGTMAFNYKTKTHIKNDGNNQEIIDNSTFSIEGNACIEGGLKLATDVQNNNFVNFTIKGGGTSCLIPKGEYENGKITFNLQGKLPTFLYSCTAKVSGVNLINISGEFGISETYTIWDGIQIDLNN